MTTKGCQNDNETGVKIAPNNKYIINYNNFFCASPAEQEEEKRNFYRDFFFRNAADPSAEVERFIAYNDSLEWRNSEGRTYETPEKRMGLARLWNFKQEGQWARPDYLKGVEAIYRTAVSENIEGVEAIINHKVFITWDGKQTRWLWTVTPEAKAWIEANREMVCRHLDPMFGGRRVSWNLIKS